MEKKKELCKKKYHWTTNYPKCKEKKIPILLKQKQRQNNKTLNAIHVLLKLKQICKYTKMVYAYTHKKMYFTFTVEKWKQTYLL